MTRLGIRRGTVGNTLLVAIIAILCLAVRTAASEAKPGDLDRSFGADGRVVIPAPARATDPYATYGLTVIDDGLTVIDAVGLHDGRTVVAANGSLYAFLPDGQLDGSFGDGGVVLIRQPQ